MHTNQQSLSIWDTAGRNHHLLRFARIATLDSGSDSDPSLTGKICTISGCVDARSGHRLTNASPMQIKVLAGAGPPRRVIALADLATR